MPQPLPQVVLTGACKLAQRNVEVITRSQQHGKNTEPLVSEYLSSLSEW
jgi:hypothetical protein